MDPVSGINQVIQTLRQRLSEKDAIMTRRKSGPQQFNEPATHTTSASKSDVQRKIADAVKRIPTDEEERGAEVFVENILAWQFGEEMLNDPKFTEMTKEVVATLAEDQEQWQTLQNYLNFLRSSSG